VWAGKNESVRVIHITLLRPLVPEETESKTFQFFFYYFSLYSLFGFVVARSSSMANFESYNDLPQQKT
jgi:hypothetical protein